jgi:hypothetical protein
MIWRRYNMDQDVHVMGNCSTVECLTYNFIKRLRKAKPHTPVLLIEGEQMSRFSQIVLACRKVTLT